MNKRLKYIILFFIIIILLYIFIFSNYYIGMGYGTSMEPMTGEGDLYIYTDATKEDIEIGDTIHFESQCSRTDNILHTVIAETDYGFITHGYNNDNPDQLYNFDEGLVDEDFPCEAPVKEEHINAKLIYIIDNNILIDIFSYFYYKIY